MIFSKLQVRLNIASLVILAIVSIAMTLAVNYFEKQQAIANAETKSLILLQHNLAVHSYFNKQLKPKIFSLTDGSRDPGYFDPTWMSSTYAVREIDKIFDKDKDNDNTYYYKEAAINARSPENEADDFEREFIQQLNKDKNQQKTSGVRKVKGKPYFYTLMRGESMEEGCMRCHTTPDKAPGDLVKTYGPSRSFNRSVGETVSAVSINIPLAEAYSDADKFSFKLSAVLLLLLFFLFILQNKLFNRLVLAPLQNFRSKADSIANDTENLGVTIPEIFTQEMNEIASSFNKMSCRLKAVVDGLDGAILERTASLKENEAKYSLLFENMANSFALHKMIYDTDGNPSDYIFIEVNPAFEKQTGLKASEIIGKTLLEVMPGIDKSWIETYGKVAKSGEPLTFENFSKELGRHYQVWAYSPKPGFFATIFNDITERTNAAKVLTSNNCKLEALLNVSSLPSSDLKVVSDHILQSLTLITESGYGFYGFINEDETVMTIHSWSGEAMQHCSMVEKPGDFPICKAGIWAEAVRRREPLILNNYAADHPAKIGLPAGHVHLSKLLVVPFFSHGKITAVAAVANRLADYTSDDVAQITGFLTNVQAITDSKQYEQSLIKSEARFRSYFNMPLIGIAITDVKKGWQEVNLHLCQMLGYTKEELALLTWADLTHPDDLAADVAKFDSLMRNEIDQYEMEKRFIRKDGSVLYAALAVSCVRKSDGQVEYTIALVDDISDRKHADEERAKLESQLHQSQKMESVGSLAGGVAHDFNNKLSVILGYTYMAFTEENPVQLKDFLEEIRKAAEQSADLTRQLLAFARKQTIAPKVLDLNETVTGMLKMLNRLIGEDIYLTWQPAADLCLIKFDPSQVDQILANLCVNARDSITKDGTITIETGNCTIDENHTARYSDALPGEYVRLAVSDNGCGMDKETMDRIFEPFFTTKAKGKGTGLGLATVFGIVKQNKGFINVYSELGVGTTFTIYIPRYIGKSEQHQDAGLAMSAPVGLETILLVEDELAILNMATLILGKQGYTVLSANTPTEAIRLAKENSGDISLLITDVIMPDMNGKELTRKLQSLYPKLKSLFMSGYTADAIAQHGVLDDGVNFIQKPFTLNALATKVREVLEQR